MVAARHLNAAGVRLVPGVGFASACAAEELEGLIRETLAAARAALPAQRGPGIESIEARQLAAPAHKRDSHMLATVAGGLELALVFPSPAALADCDGALRTESARARAVAGVGSAAEAAALAVAGNGARLLLPRRLSPRASCAVAVVETNTMFEEQ